MLCVRRDAVIRCLRDWCAIRLCRSQVIVPLHKRFSMCPFTVWVTSQSTFTLTEIYLKPKSKKTFLNALSLWSPLSRLCRRGLVSVAEVPEKIPWGDWVVMNWRWPGVATLGAGSWASRGLRHDVCSQNWEEVRRIILQNQSTAYEDAVRHGSEVRHIMTIKPVSPLPNSITYASKLIHSLKPCF